MQLVLSSGFPNVSIFSLILPLFIGYPLILASSTNLHVKSQIVMYVNNKPSLHITLLDLFIYLLNLFIALNNLIISYIPFIAMYKQLNIVPIYITLYFMSGVHGVAGCVWLGVCGSAVVPQLWRLGGFGAVMFGNTAELGGQGFQ